VEPDCVSKTAGVSSTSLSTHGRELAVISPVNGDVVENFSSVWFLAMAITEL
jgi:hypothetical protein